MLFQSENSTFATVKVNEILDWLVTLFTSNSIAHAVLIIGLTIAVGLLLGRIKFGSVSLGITWVLFVGIVLSHLGLGIDEQICHFVKEFGLILFVYSIGLQVGPGFISSLKEGGVTLNSLAVLIILLGCATCYVIHLITGEDLTTMIGVLSGAVTNTPGLGAAQQTVADTLSDPNIAAQITNEQASASVSFMDSIRGSIIWIAFIDNADGSSRVRLRSRFVPVNPLAEKYRGGGHECACGATLYSKEEMAQFIADADALIKEYKENNEGWL